MHGAKDTLVDALESQTLYDLLIAEKIPAVLKVCEGMDHSFDYDLTAEKEWGATFDEAFEFIFKYF